jgi:hypothetical protein
MMNEKTIKNKMVDSEEVKNKEVVLTEYYFPDYSITVKANSREEAEQILLTLIK